MFSDQHNHEQL